MHAVILAIDLGTTSLKGILVDESGTTIDREAIAQGSPPAVDGWFANLKSIVERLRQRRPEHRIAAISITGQMHGTQIYDAKEEPAEPCLLWTNREASPHLPRLLERTGPSLPMRIGSTIAPGFQALNLFVRGDWDNVSRVLLPKDTLIHRLTGRFVTDPSDAAGTGLFDGGTGSWAWDIVDALSIPRRVLPDVVASGTVVGSMTSATASELELPAETPVIIAGGDTPVAARGAGTSEPCDVQIMLSTSAQVLTPAVTWEPHPTAMWYTWPAAKSVSGPGARWLRSGTMSNGGSVVDWLNSIQGEVVLDDIAPVPIVALPHLAGRRFPAADIAASGAFIGLRGTHTSTDLYAAMLQGIAFSYREVFEALTADRSGLNRIRFGGGGSQIPGFAQLLATVLGHPIERIGGSDLTCDGAAILAAETLGWTPKTPSSGEIFQPDAARSSSFNALYDIYLDANAAVLSLSHRLHELQ
jgi:xylulokinase